jgi:hypothetical protein
MTRQISEAQLIDIVGLEDYIEFVAKLYDSIKDKNKESEIVYGVSSVEVLDGNWMVYEYQLTRKGTIDDEFGLTKVFVTDDVDSVLDNINNVKSNLDNVVFTQSKL